MKARMILSQRNCDEYGCGHYGASRGNRTHKGIDYVCEVGAEVYPDVSGIVTKIGYPYSDDLSYKYVQISSGGYHYRYFYLNPVVLVGQAVSPDTVIGTVQNLDRRYAGITPHVHKEVKDESGNYYNPEEVV